MFCKIILFTIIGLSSGNFINYDSVYEFSKMANNAYYSIGSKYWLNTTLDIVENRSIEPDTVKAYTFRNIANDKIVIAFKGTSVYWTSLNTISDKTFNKYENMCTLSSSSNDKYNDNLFFSCCFYKQSNLFKTCDNCGVTEGTECCRGCYSNSLSYKENYINIVKEIVDNISLDYDFDKTEVYFTGHSLGGMLASVASIIYDKPAVTFETPGDLHYIQVSGLSDRGSDKIYHFGHNGDPIFIGKCGSTCSVIGYNIDTKCHTGFTCSYDAKKKLGYSESIFNHRIEYIIKNVISKWKDDFPVCIRQTDCSDCDGWKFT